MAEGARLESVFRGNSNQGSNPCLSAIISSLESTTSNPACWHVPGFVHTCVVLSIYRRHREACKYGDNRVSMKCRCALWAKGTLEGRPYQKSLKTRNFERAEQIKRKLEDGIQAKEQPKAITFKSALESYVKESERRNLNPTTLRKYKFLQTALDDHSQKSRVPELKSWTTATVSAVAHMRTEDYFENGKRWWIRFHEKGGKRHEVPAHHTPRRMLMRTSMWPASWMTENHLCSGVWITSRQLTANPHVAHGRTADDQAARAGAAGLPSSTSCHTFRATGITAYLENGGTIEHAQAIAAHESPRTTKLYDRTSDRDHARRDRTDRHLKRLRPRNAPVNCSCLNSRGQKHFLLRTRRLQFTS